MVKLRKTLARYSRLLPLLFLFLKKNKKAKPSQHWCGSCCQPRINCQVSGTSDRLHNCCSLYTRILGATQGDLPILSRVMCHSTFWDSGNNFEVMWPGGLTLPSNEPMLEISPLGGLRGWGWVGQKIKEWASFAYAASLFPVWLFGAILHGYLKK